MSALPVRAAAAADLRVEIVEDYRDFLALEHAWNEVLAGAGIEHPFLTHEWLRTWWECFGGGGRLCIVAVRAGASIVALAPLMLTRVRVYGVPARRLGSISNVHTPRFDFLVADRGEEAYAAIWRTVQGLGRLWDLFELSQLPSGSRTLDAMSGLAAAAGHAAGAWRSADSPFVPMRGGWDEFLHALGAKHRANLRNRLRRLGRIGELRLETVTAEGGLETALEDGFRLEAARWKGRNDTAILSRPDTRRFYTELSRRAAGRGWLDLQFLKVADRRVAFGCTLRYGGRLYLLKQGYDPDYAVYSPFNLLCFLALRQAFERGLVEYDLLGEPEAWKREWTGTARPHRWLHVFSEAPRGRLLGYAKLRLVPRWKRTRAWRALGSVRWRQRSAHHPPGS